MSTTTQHIDPKKNIENNTETSFTPEQIKAAKGKRIFRKIQRFIWRLFKWLVLIPATIIVAVLVILVIPMVQTFIAQKASDYLTEVSGFQVSIEKMRINLLNQDILLKGLKIIDRQNQKMIDLEEFSTNFDLFGTVQGKNIYLDKFFLKNGEVNLIVNPKTKDLNIQEFIDVIDSLTAPKQRKPRKKGERAAVFAIDEVFLDEITLSYNDSRQDSIKNGFDYAHFKFHHLDGYLQKFLIVADTISFEAQNLQALDKASGLDIRNLNVHFLQNKNSLQFNRLYGEVNNSILQDSLVFNFESMKDWGDFNRKVRIEARLDSTIIHTKDLAMFAPELRQYDDLWHLTGNFSGTVENFTFTDFLLKFGKKTSLVGSMSVEGLPKVENILASFQLERNSAIHTPDLQQYIPDKQANTYVQKFGDVLIQGRFDGYPSDFKANAKMQTGLGTIDLNTYFIQKNNEIPAYQGTIALENFKLGTLLEVAEVGSVSMEGSVEGKGFTAETLDAHFDGKINAIDALNYTYRDIALNGTFKKKFFEGIVKSNDANAHLDLQGTIDFNLKQPELRITSEVAYLDFKNLGFSKQDLNFRGFVHSQSKGFSLDELEGSLLLKEASIGYNSKKLAIDSLTLEMQTNEYGYHFIDLNSSLLKVSVVGKYQTSHLGEAIVGFFNELFLGIKNQEEVQSRYYQAKQKKKSKNVSLEYEIAILDSKPLLGLFDTTAYITPETKLKGLLVSGDSSRFTLKSEKPIQAIEFGNQHLYRNTIQFEAYKNRLDDNITAELNAYSNTQNFGGFESEKLSLQLIWLDGIIDFRTKVKQKESTNEADIQGHITLDTNRTIIEFDESSIRVLDAVWKFEPSRKIVVYTNENGKVVFENFMLSNQKQEIALNGMIAAGVPDEKLKVDINNFQLNTLNALLKGKKLNGVIDAHLTIEDVYEEMKVNAQFTVDSVSINKFYVGNIKGRSAWNNEKQVMDLSCSIFHKKDYIFFLDGTYQPRNNYLDLLAKLRNMEVNIVEPFVDEFISELDGTISGDIKITGKPSEPDLDGIVRFDKAKFKVNYLGAKYQTSSSISIAKNELTFRKFRMFDKERQLATLNGKIYHDKFQHLFIEITADFEKFILLDTKEKENALYYGTAIGTGKMLVQGEPQDIYIKIDAKTDKGTRLYLPLDGYSEVGDANYFQFTDFENDKKTDTTGNLTTPVKTVKLAGLQMDMNLNVTEDAEFEIQLDRQTGDIMKGTGKGLMQMNIDKRGNFGIWGDYNISSGTYNFTLKNLMSKKFNIKPDSKIYFEGDVYKAYMDVKASYDDARTSFTAFLSETEITPETSRRFPVSVVAHLVGDLLAPKVSFSIDFNDLEKKVANPALQAAMFKVKSDIQSNELELNRQVGSLIILGQFTSQGASGNVGAASGRTLGEFLSNQLSGYLSKIDENFEINLNASELGANSTLVGLRLSYTLLDGRLKVISDNRLDSRNQNSNYTGEWIVEYALTDDGQYKLKMYNRSTFGNNIITATTANSTGASVVFSRSGNSLRDLFRSKAKKEKQKRKANNQKQENELQKQPGSTQEQEQ